MRVREAVTRSGRGYRGHLPSKKLNRSVQFESLLERDAAMIFEFSPGVISYQEQPAIIEYEDQGVIRRYFPDFELRLRNDEILHVEVKPESVLKRPDIRTKFTSIALRYERHEADFIILTEKALRNEVLNKNLRLLYRALFAHRNIDLVSEAVRHYLRKQQAASFLQLSRQFGEEEILMMLANFELICDFHQDFKSPSNLIRIPVEADYATLQF